MKRFGLIGAAGYVAPRHMKAIKAVSGDLVVALDPKDSVGILDSYFPDAHFFIEFERFDRHIDKLHRGGARLDYISVCSPNFLHDAHCRFALRSGIDAICEKPVVLNPWNLDGLQEIERASGRKTSAILQLRLHPAIQALKSTIAASSKNEFAVDLTYITSRGRWYHSSWKGDEPKSGGVVTNIGVHFFDMLIHVFGAPRRNVVHLRSHDRAGGYLECGRAKVRWFVSVNRKDLPPEVVGKQTTYRSITIDGQEVEFSEGFTDLHTRSYEEILAGRGFGLNEVRASIEIVSAFRSSAVELKVGEQHPLTAAIARA